MFCNSNFVLQQYLPFTVLKQVYHSFNLKTACKLQQYLPFTVLKPLEAAILIKVLISSCNSTYRLRYWN